MPNSLNQQRLEQQISSWRTSLGAINQDQCTELEDHLRSSLPELIDKGLSIDEAVLLAAARLEGAVNIPQETRAPQTIRHPVLRVLLDLLICVIAGFGVMASVLITLYALTYQHITSAGTGLALAVGSVACVLMAYIFRKAVIDVRDTTTGALIST